jgi:hypothetical protein
MQRYLNTAFSTHVPGVEFETGYLNRVVLNFCQTAARQILFFYKTRARRLRNTGLYNSKLLKPSTERRKNKPWKLLLVIQGFLLITVI